MASAEDSVDVILAGGGLANSLIALRLKALRPTLRIVLLEREATVGGEHTWCSFASDMSAATATWLAPLVVTTWPAYEVRFPSHRRVLDTEYRAITSARLHEVVSETLGANVWLGAQIDEVTPSAVRLADGRTLTAPLVIDARGARRSPSLALGWQKFLGVEVRLAVPHGLVRPVVMDATVAQLDGYRFLYVLPLAPDRLLIEDTRYSDDPRLDLDGVRVDIDAYAADRGWAIAETLRSEQGVLPVALGGDIDAYWREAAPGVPEAGLRSALFHPTTGYSLPDAARAAEAIAALPLFTSAAVRSLMETRSKAVWAQRSYYRLLNRMMFRACAPSQRYRVLERFYRLSQGLVERFYAGNATWTDKARILMGKPPVPVMRAMACLSERSAFTTAPA